MKAKAHPAVFVALLAVAVLVTGESVVAFRQIELSGAAWANRIRACGSRVLTDFVVRTATSVVARGAKS